MIQTIDLTPTPTGIRQVRRLYEEQALASQELIEEAEGWLPSRCGIEAEAFEALIERESRRLKEMHEGIRSCNRALGEEW